MIFPDIWKEVKPVIGWIFWITVAEIPPPAKISTWEEASEDAAEDESDDDDDEEESTEQAERRMCEMM